jgi:ADP-ribosylglycohydrolase
LKYQNRTYENGEIGAFGKGFLQWVNTGVSINSSSNGCVMRISPLLHIKQDQQSLFKKADEITKITHNHPESLNAVHAYLETGFMIQNLIPIDQIKETISDKYQYNLHQSLDEIRPNYNRFYVKCKNSVPQAIICALDACSYEDALRNAVSLGGDSDTLACMAGGLAELRFKIPTNIIANAKKYMDKDIRKLIKMFYNMHEK